MKVTKEEKAWIAKLNKLLSNPPSDRFGFYTIGDPDVSVFDTSKEPEIDEGLMSGKYSDFGQAVEDLDAVVGSLKFPACVHSVAG